VPAETLRRACEDILDQRDGRTMRVTLGEPTLEALGNRLAEEVRRAIVESVDGPSRGVRVPLGEGTEVLGAMWGAIARIQEIVAQRTGGAVRFGGDAPEGAIALAPWLHHDLPGADRMSMRGRGAAADVRLDRRRVVVADDDPGVTWFIADLLRTAGCEVYEALDGRMALDTAFRVSPELVVSDILMPGMDGFALCRALKRDVALRDTPVILLSWKEDLLQRVRELGASAAAYMRKESDSRAVVARVREVLRPRARIEARIKSTEEVRGRLDGITVRLLLELSCMLRKNARVGVRDASFLYEIEIREGAPVQATRTAPDGSFQRGPQVLAQMLGIGAGRFVVAPSAEHVKSELEGSLGDQLARPLSRARGALLATTGAAMMHVERVTLDALVMADYLRATPEPARAILKQLAEGASPRQMMLGGEIAPAMIEEVLADLAARGAIVGVRGAGGNDLLGPQVDAAMAILEGRPAERPRYSQLPPPPPLGAPPASSPIGRVQTKRIAVPAAPMIAEEVPAEVVAKYESLTMSEPPPPLVPRMEDAAPSSLEDAVMREISERASQPRVPSDPPPLVEVGALRPRSNPPSEGETDRKPDGVPAADESDPTASDRRALPSIPPDAIVPATAPSDEVPVALPSPVELPLIAGAPLGALESAPAELSEATEVDAPVAEKHAEKKAEPSEKPATDPNTPKTKISPPHAPVDEKPLRVVSERTPSPAAVSTERDAPKRSAWPAIAALAFIALVVGFGLRYASPSSDQAAPQPSETSEPRASAAQLFSAAPPQPSAAASDTLPPGVDVPPGKGLAEVLVAGEDAIRVDGEARGKGPQAFVALAPGAHEVRVGAGASEKVRRVEISAGRRALVDLR
jgi:CheY-like chemotaxis protein